MSPKVSVVVKAYNHAPYIHQTIQSVLDQSFQDFEIVVTDDGSTDGTPDVVRQFQDPRIKFDCLPRNHGISIAMNSVLARAKGEYVAILNSDDYALPGRLERQVALLDEKPEISVLFGLPVVVDEVGNDREPFNDFDRPLAFPDLGEATWLNSFFFKGNCLCAPTAMIRRSVYEAVGRYDPRLTNLQDLDMWVRMLKAGHRFFMSPERFTAFRIRDGNKNMSAPRADSFLRHSFETMQILKHYSSMAPRLIIKVFSKEMASAGIAPDVRPELLLAQMALTVPKPEYGLFAMQLLFDKAESVDDFHRLRDLSGKVDVFGTFTLQSCMNQLAKLKASLLTKGRF